MTKDPIPKKLYDVLACPVCKGELNYDKDKKNLVCSKCKLKFPIKDGVPVLLPKKK